MSGVREKQEMKGLGGIEGGLKAEERRRGGIGNRGQLAYEALKRWTSGTVRNGEKRHRRPGTIECQIGKLGGRENARSLAENTTSSAVRSRSLVMEKK
jgi:hypothetical protein